MRNEESYLWIETFLRLASHQNASKNTAIDWADRAVEEFKKRYDV